MYIYIHNSCNYNLYITIYLLFLYISSYYYEFFITIISSMTVKSMSFFCGFLNLQSVCWNIY